MSRQNQVGKHATVIYTDDLGFTCVKYHQTDVVKFNHQKVILNSGGWHTNTTKLRMNQASAQFDLGFGVYQKDFDWYVDFRNRGNDEGYWQGKPVEFYDKMVFDRV